MSDTEQAARDFYNTAGGSYAPIQPDAPAQPVAAPTEIAAPVAAPAPTEPTGQAVEDATRALYGPDAVTRGLVDWDEPAATAREFDLQAPPGLLDRSDAGRAALDRLRDGLAEAGAGQTLARELFGDAIRAQQDGRPVATRDKAEAELRQHYGPHYDAQIAAARGLVQRAAARCPEIVPFLERTGLGNSPEFVRKLAAAAGRRGRR